MNKQIIMLMIFSLLLVSMASALTLTLQTTQWNALTNINVSFAAGTGDRLGENVTAVSIFASSPSTANSSSMRIINLTNASDQNFMIMASANFSLADTIILEDANDYSITAVVTGNGGVSGVALSATSAIVDRTVPQKPTSLTTGTVNADGTITATVNGANTTGCSISFGLGGQRLAMTHSANSCTYTVTKFNPSDGTYDYNVLATDGRNNSILSDTAIVNIDATANPSRRSPSSLSSSVTQATGVASKTRNILIGGLAFVVIDMLFGLGIVFKKR